MADSSMVCAEKCPCKGLGDSVVSLASSAVPIAALLAVASSPFTVGPWCSLLNREHQVHTHQCRNTGATSAAADTGEPLQVTHLLSEESREHASVAALTSQLVELQAEVQTAHERLHQTQARVEHNLERVSALEAEAASLEKMRQQSAPEGSSSQGVPRRAPAAAAVRSATALESHQVGRCCSEGVSMCCLVGARRQGAAAHTG